MLGVGCGGRVEEPLESGAGRGEESSSLETRRKNGVALRGEVALHRSEVPQGMK